MKKRETKGGRFPAVSGNGMGKNGAIWGILGSNF